MHAALGQVGVAPPVDRSVDEDRAVVADVETVEARIAEHADAADADAWLRRTPARPVVAADSRRQLEQAVDVARRRQFFQSVALEGDRLRAFCTSTVGVTPNHHGLGELADRHGRVDRRGEAAVSTMLSRCWFVNPAARTSPYRCRPADW